MRAVSGLLMHYLEIQCFGMWFQGRPYFVLPQALFSQYIETQAHYLAAMTGKSRGARVDNKTI